MATDERIVIAQLSEEELRLLEAEHPEIQRGESAFVIAGSHPLVLALSEFVAHLEQQHAQSQRVLDALTRDLDTVVLGRARVLQLQRQAEARARFLREVPTLTSAEIAELCGSVARNASATASRWKADRRIFAVNVGRMDRYPAFQFGQDGKPIPAVAEIIRLFEGQGEWALALWFVSAPGWLGGRTPAELLAEAPDAVVDAARRAVEPLAI